MAKICQSSRLPIQFVKQIKNMDEYNELIKLAESGGLSLEAMANLSQKSKYPLEIIKLLRSTEEGAIYIEKAGLVADTVNGQTALIRTIDLTTESEVGGEIITNLERMRKGLAPLDSFGNPYELHHIGQSIDSPLAILTQFEHRSSETYSILHDSAIADGQGVHSLMSDAEWDAIRKAFWKAMAARF